VWAGYSVRRERESDSGDTLAYSIPRFVQKAGFTLIELLVVIAIISLLSSVVLASLSGARESARDTRRKQDLKQIKTALNMWANDHSGNYMGNGSGCGYDGNGIGWFNYDYSGAKAMSACLADQGYTSSEINDPSGNTTEAPTYMKYTCDKGTFVYAQLEGEPAGDVLPNDVCSAHIDTTYGINHYLQVD